MTNTTNHPYRRSQEDTKRLYKWRGLDSLTTTVHMLGGWPLLVSNLTPAFTYLHAVFAARHSRVIENVRAGMAPGEIIRALLGKGLNLKGVLYFILLRGRYEAPGNKKAYHYDSIVFVDDRSLTIPRLEDLGVPMTPETLHCLKNII